MRSEAEISTRKYLRRRREERRRWYRQQALIDVCCAVVGIASCAALVYLEWPVLSMLLK